ncbi:MAG: type II 3-dehydroquinate dehydratase [Acidobacteriota bacterium]
MTRLLLLHGPNLNRLGRRDPAHYGTLTLAELEARVRARARAHGVEVHAFQSNCEGALIDAIQRAADDPDCLGAIVNAGALTHTSYALHDALVDFGRPVVEVHLSAVSGREPWRRVSVIRPACIAAIEGRGADGYDEAVDRLVAAAGR